MTLQTLTKSLHSLTARLGARFGADSDNLAYRAEIARLEQELFDARMDKIRAETKAAAYASELASHERSVGYWIKKYVQLQRETAGDESGVGKNKCRDTLRTHC